jgi:hypothetical protein
VDPDDASAGVIAILGEPAAMEFLEVLERPDQERAVLIGRLNARGDRARWMAELLMVLEDDLGEIVGCGWSTRSANTSTVHSDIPDECD